MKAQVPETATTPSVLVSDAAIHRDEESDWSSAIICDLADSEAFVETRGKPHVPVMSAFGAGRLHVCRLYGSWDLDKAAAEHASAMFRSIRFIHSKKSKEPTEYWDDLTFRFGPRAFIYLDKDRIIGFGATPGEAERLAKNFGNAFGKPALKSNSGGEFYLIQVEGTEIKCHAVSLSPGTILPAKAIDLHYGLGGEAWHRSFVAKLSARDRGLSIFEGVPGTGKSYYIRHLMGVLRESHRFYFIPAASLLVLSRAEFIGFWAGQRRQHSDRQFVVVLEDSDAALMTRGSDNREQVSAILNLSDGLLGDFLRLQIICTINCPASDIDPALLRPGRLLCHRVFGRLDYTQALQLSESLGRKLPVASDYSLAEVFAGIEKYEINRPRIGFAT